jgi:cytochrome c5
MTMELPMMFTFDTCRSSPACMRKPRSLRALFAGNALALVMLLPQGAGAQQSAAASAKVYTEVCAVCHAAGVANAPKLGDKAAWAPLIKEGQAVLTAHAWVGVRGMPARGGRPDLSLEAFSGAVAHMARAAGGNWKEPDAALLARIRTEEAKRIAALKTAK